MYSTGLITILCEDYNISKLYAYEVVKIECGSRDYIPRFGDLVESIVVKASCKPKPYINPLTNKKVAWKKYQDLYMATLIDTNILEVEKDVLEFGYIRNFIQMPIVDDKNATMYIKYIFLSNALLQPNKIYEVLQLIVKPPPYIIKQKIHAVTDDKYIKTYHTHRKSINNTIKNKHINNELYQYIPIVDICNIICEYLSDTTIFLCDGQFYKTHTISSVKVCSKYISIADLKQYFTHLTSISIFPMKSNKYFTSEESDNLHSNITLKVHGMNFSKEICINNINVNRMLFGWDVLHEKDILEYSIIISGDNENIYDISKHGSLRITNIEEFFIQYSSDVADSYNIVFRGF